MKVKKASGVSLLCAIIFIVFGVITIAVGVFLFADSKAFEADAEKTTAVITEINSYYSGSGKKRKQHHNVYVEYTVDRKQYNSKLDYYTAGMHEGEEIEIFYNPDNPAEIRGGGNTSVMVLCITGGLGAIFAVVGAFLLRSSIKGKRGKKRLLESGTKLTGRITNVVADTKIRINGQNPCKAECEVTDPATGEKYLYSSDGVMNDLYSFIGASVDVYIDPSDKSKSYIDLESIRQESSDGVRIHDFR